MGLEKYSHPFGQVRVHPECLDEPKGLKGGMVFVCSMSDLFHADVPDEFLERVFDVIRENPQCIFQVLTKRAARMAEFFRERQVPKNCWVGVTCESNSHLDRMRILKEIDAPVRFLSCEPLLAGVNLELEGIDWVIAGGESGASARPSKPEWFRFLRDQCRLNATPFFFKQWGTFGEDGVRRSKKENGRLLDGEEIMEWPGAYGSRGGLSVIYKDKAINDKMGNIQFVEATSEWKSTGVRRLTILTANGEGKVQVDLINHEDGTFGRTALIWDLYVAEEYRRKGVARQLMQYALQRAKEYGFTTATLEWDVRDSIREIAWWYESLGFEEKAIGNGYSLMVKNIFP